MAKLRVAVSRIASIGAAFGLAVLVAACAVLPTPYQPQDERGYGYREQGVETDRFRITFTGNSYTTREQVENYLLYRAAELTLERDKDYFIVERQDTERKERVITSVHHAHYRAFPYTIYGGYWRADRVYAVDSYRLVDRYEAVAIVKIYSGEPPEDNVSAYDARDVIKTLEPLIVRPEPESEKD